MEIKDFQPKPCQNTFAKLKGSGADLFKKVLKLKVTARYFESDCRCFLFYKSLSNGGRKTARKNNKVPTVFPVSKVASDNMSM